MAKGSKIMSVRIPGPLLERLKMELRLKAPNVNDEVPAVGDWIRTAIIQRLDHLERSRGQSAKKRVLCDDCKIRVQLDQVACCWTNLFDKKEYRCIACDRKRDRM